MSLEMFAHKLSSILTLFSCPNNTYVSFLKQNLHNEISLRQIFVTGAVQSADPGAALGIDAGRTEVISYTAFGNVFVSCYPCFHLCLLSPGAIST